ncbi:MAG: hypothetical protein HOD92_09170 [Deltaproteobacteria bacterium]|jgi:hypothetical protein|nr:hypothetical protein [Deltaproteobacteria bacterium]
MPNYILAYHGGEQPKTPEAGAKHMSRYKEWLGSLGETLVNPPSPFGKKMSVSSEGVSECKDPNYMTGFCVVNAKSLEDAIEIAKGDPFLGMNGTIVVAEKIEM